MSDPKQPEKKPESDVPESTESESSSFEASLELSKDTDSSGSGDNGSKAGSDSDSEKSSNSGNGDAALLLTDEQIEEINRKDPETQALKDLFSRVKEAKPPGSMAAELNPGGGKLRQTSELNDASGKYVEHLCRHRQFGQVRQTQYLTGKNQGRIKTTFENHPRIKSVEYDTANPDRPPAVEYREGFSGEAEIPEALAGVDAKGQPWQIRADGSLGRQLEGEPSSVILYTPFDAAGRVQSKEFKDRRENTFSDKTEIEYTAPRDDGLVRVVESKPDGEIRKDYSGRPDGLSKEEIKTDGDGRLKERTFAGREDGMVAETIRIAPDRSLVTEKQFTGRADGLTSDTTAHVNGETTRTKSFEGREDGLVSEVDLADGSVKREYKDSKTGEIKTETLTKEDVEKEKQQNAFEESPLSQEIKDLDSDNPQKRAEASKKLVENVGNWSGSDAKLIAERMPVEMLDALSRVDGDKISADSKETILKSLSNYMDPKAESVTQESHELATRAAFNLGGVEGLKTMGYEVAESRSEYSVKSSNGTKFEFRKLSDGARFSAIRERPDGGVFVNHFADDGSVEATYEQVFDGDERTTYTRNADSNVKEIGRADGSEVHFDYDGTTPRSIRDSHGYELTSEDGKNWKLGFSEGTIEGELQVGDKGEIRIKGEAEELILGPDASITRVDLKTGISTRVEENGVSTTRDKNGDVVKTTARDGEVSQYKRDDNGKLTEIKNSSGTWKLNDEGKWQSETTGEADSKERWVDKEGRLHVKDEDGSQVVKQLDGSRLTLDSKERITEVLASNGLKTTFEYEGDDTRPVSVVYGDSKFKWVSTNDDHTSWKKLERKGDRYVDTGRTWDGVIEATEKGHRETYQRTGKQVARNSDGSVIVRDKDDRITSVNTADGGLYKFQYDNSGQLNHVTRPDGSTASISGTYGWYSGGKALGGARVDQKTGRYTEFDDDLNSMQHTSDGLKSFYDSRHRVTARNFGAGRQVDYRRDDLGKLEASVTVNADKSVVRRQFDGSRIQEGPDGYKQSYDADGQLASVERPDKSKVTVTRDQNGKIEKLTDTKNAITFSRDDEGTFVREGSQPPDKIDGAEAFINPDGTFGFRNAEREILRTKEGFEIKSRGLTTELLNNGSSRIRDSFGDVFSAQSARGDEWSVKKTILENGERRVDTARVGDRLWSRDGESSNWTSGDGQQFAGEINLDDAGNLRFIEAGTNFETVRKLDGSTLFRDSEGRVHKTISPEGKETSYAYTKDGGLARIELPDGTTLNKIPSRKTESGSVERWVEAGTTNVLEGKRSVDSQGNLVIEAKNETVVKQSDGWDRIVAESGEVTYQKVGDNGSSVTKNEMGQIVASRDAEGFGFKYGYNDQGKLNRIEYSNGKVWQTEDGINWTGVKNGKSSSWKGEALITDDGALVWKAPKDGGGSIETIYGSDGAVLRAEDGRFTDLTHLGKNKVHVEYGEDGKPNQFSDASGNGAYWKTEDGEVWKKYNAEGVEDTSVKPEKFKLSIGADGSMLKNYFDARPPYTEIDRTDGSTLKFSSEGKKLFESRLEFYERGKPQYLETEYKYDKDNRLESYHVTKPDGSNFDYDRLGRMTRAESGPLTNDRGARRAREVREFEYVGDTDILSAYVKNGERFQLDRQSIESGSPRYRSSSGDVIPGQLRVEDDGTVLSLRNDGALIYESLDGSTITQLGSGAMLKHRYDGFLDQRVLETGLRESFGYKLSSYNHVLGRRNQLSTVKREFTDGRVHTWQTSDGFNWRRREDGRNWEGFTHIDHATGNKVNRYTSGNTYEIGLDGREKHLRSVDIKGSTGKIEESIDYWTQSGMMEVVRSHLRPMDAEETYMVRRRYSNDDGALRRAFKEELSSHRLTEALGYLDRTESVGYERDGMKGENYAIQLKVDAQEYDRWWWNRDRSREEIRSSTRHILGTASGSTRRKIDAAYGRMYGSGDASSENNLARFYGEGGEGHDIADYDGYHRTLISIASKAGVDERTAEQQSRIIDSALSSAYYNRLDYMSEAAGKNFSTEEGRAHFMENGGEGKIKSAFTQTHYDEYGGSHTTVDQFAIQQATDYARRGELRPITEFRKAFGVFSNDSKAMEHALSRMNDQERALLADGKKLFDEGTIPSSEGQQEALEYYKDWHKAFRDAHWFSEEAKATGYEDQALRKGGSDINDNVTVIGTHWTNSHEVNATAIEDISLEGFNLLTEGMVAEGDKPTSPYYEQMRDALSKNLGGGDYIARANTLLDQKMQRAFDITRAADGENFEQLREYVPSFAGMPDSRWSALTDGYKVNKGINDGTLKPDNLSPEQSKHLEAYRKKNDLRTFMEGRAVARHLNEIDTGVALQKFRQGAEINREIESGKLDREKLSNDQKELLSYFDEYGGEHYRKGQEIYDQIQAGTLKEETLGKDQKALLSHFNEYGGVRFQQGREIERQIAAGTLNESDLNSQQKDLFDHYQKFKSLTLDDNDLTLARSAIIEQRGRFFMQLGEPGKASLDGYQRLLYDSVKTNVRRDILTALEDNDGYFSDDHSAMLDALANMRSEERIKYRDDTNGYQSELEGELKEKLGGEDSIAYKAAEVLLDQIKNDDSRVPARPSENLAYKLLKQRVDGKGSPREFARTISGALKNDRELGAKLLNDEQFKEAATAAVGSHRYDSLVKTLLEDGRLPVSTLVEINTILKSDGETTYEDFESGEFFKDAVLNASPGTLKYLASEEGARDKKLILDKLPGGAKEIFENVLQNRRSRALEILEGEGAEIGPRVDPEDRIRAFVVGSGPDQDDVRDILGSLSEQERVMAVQDYNLKYGSSMTGDLIDKVDSSDRDEFEYLSRASEWTTEQSHLFNIEMVSSTDAGIGGSLARSYNMMHRMALSDFEFEKWKNGGHIEPKRMRELNEAVQKSVDAFIETKDATAETVVTGIITAGALAAAPFTGGTSLAALYATGGVILAGGAIGAGTKYVLMGNDHQGIRAIAGDFVKFSALTAANVLDPAHISMAGGLGNKAAVMATEKAFASAAVKGVTNEVREQVTKGMMQLVRDGIAHGGGVADDAIVKMLGKVNGLDDIARAQLAKGLKASLRTSVEETAKTGLRQVLAKAATTARAQGKSMGLITLAGAGGNVIGDAANMLITRGEINGEQLVTSAAVGGTFAFGIGGMFKLGGAGLGRVLSRNAPDAPHVNVDGTPAVVEAPHVTPEGVHVTRVDEPTVRVESPELRAANDNNLESNVIPFERPAGRVNDVAEPPARRVASMRATEELVEGAQDTAGPATRMREAANLEVYEPVVPPSNSARQALLEASIPQLNREGADQFADMMKGFRESMADDLRPDHARVVELHEQVLEADQHYKNLVEDLKGKGISQSDIDAATRNRNHPLNEEHSIYQTNRNRFDARELHVRANLRLAQKVGQRVKELQKTVDQFTESRGLPRVKIESKKPGNLGDYSSGNGTIYIDETAFLEPGGDALLSRVVFHEMVHLEQDSLLVRKAIADAGFTGKDLNFDAIEKVKAEYVKATGVENVDSEFLENVANHYKNSDPLTAEQITRANKLADDAKSYQFEVSQSTELGNTARVLSSTGKALLRQTDPHAVNKLFNRITGTEGKVHRKRMFGDEGIPADIQVKLDEWHKLPKDDNGLAVGFNEGEVRAKLVGHIERRLEAVNTEHKMLVNSYFENGLEQEAYGLDHMIVDSEKRIYGDDFHEKNIRRKETAQTDLEGVDKSNLARVLDDAYRNQPAAVGSSRNLSKYNIRIGDNSEPVVLNGTSLSLGRGRDVDIPVVGDQVSRTHARIFADGNGKPHIMNLSESNYTFVNGNKVDVSQPIEPGDVIGLGFYRGDTFVGSQFTFGDSYHAAMPLDKGLGKYQLVSESGVHIDFHNNKVTVGRVGEGADLQFHGDTVSARHAEIEITADGPVLRDTKSRNGTFVNGERISGDTPLKPGDRIRFSPGTEEIVFGRKLKGNLEDFKLSSQGTNLEFPEGSTKVVFGRSSENSDVIIGGRDIDVSGVSRKHAEIRYEDGKIVIEDLGSRNGTYVNGVEISGPKELTPGDSIRFGADPSAEFVFKGDFAAKFGTGDKTPIAGTNYMRGDRVRVDDARFLNVEAQVIGIDPQSDNLLVVVKDGYQHHVRTMDDAYTKRMIPVGSDGDKPLFKDRDGTFYSRYRLADGKYTLISRPDIQVISKAKVVEPWAQIDFQVGQHIENANHKGVSAEVVGYTNDNGNPIVRLKKQSYSKKTYELDKSYNPRTGEIRIGDESLTPIDVEGNKLYHDSQGNIYGADFADDGSDVFIYRHENLKVWDRATSARAQYQPKKVGFEPKEIAMPRSFDELPDVNAPRSHSDNVLYEDTEFYLNGKPMTVNGEKVNFENGEIVIGRELLGIEYEGAGTYVSAEHGKFGWDAEEQMFYFDDHSTNGTYVRRANGEEFVKYKGSKDRPKRVYLAPGDELRLGSPKGERLDISLSSRWTRKRGANVESTQHTQVFFDGKLLEMDGNSIEVGRKFQVYGNQNPTDALNRRVARHHAQLIYDEATNQWQITDLSGASAGGDDYSVSKTIMLRDEGNGIFVKEGGSGRISFYANERVPLGPNDRVYIGSSKGPELKLVTRTGQPLGDGRVSFLNDNLDRIVTRPDGSHTVTSYTGSSRLVSPDGTVAESTMASGRRLRFKYENKELQEIVLPDNSTVVRSGDNNWVRKTVNGKEEPWWKGSIEVEQDGSLKYQNLDNPPHTVIQRLDNIVETVDPNGRVTYGDVDLNFEKQSLSDYAKTLAHPDRRERFTGMMDDFETYARQQGFSDNQIAQSYHQIRRLLQADEGSFLHMGERQKLAEQTLFQMTNPDKISQGANNTCNVTTIEKRILQRHPEEYARLVSDVATTGKYVTADGTLIDMSRVQGALEPDSEARMLAERIFDPRNNTDLHLNGRRSWASQIFETTAVGIKYARGGDVQGEFVGPGEIVLYQKTVGLPGQEAEQLVKYGVGPDGRLTTKVLDNSPKIGASELTDINNQIIGKHEENFVIGGHLFPDAHDVNRYWDQSHFSPGTMKIARSTDELKDMLIKMQDDGNFPAVAMVHTGHQFFGGNGSGGGAHVINIKGIRQTQDGIWVVDFTNQWGALYDGQASIDEMFKVMNAPGTQP